MRLLLYLVAGFLPAPAHAHLVPKSPELCKPALERIADGAKEALLAAKYLPTNLRLRFKTAPTTTALPYGSLDRAELDRQLAEAIAWAQQNDLVIDQALRVAARTGSPHLLPLLYANQPFNYPARDFRNYKVHATYGTDKRYAKGNRLFDLALKGGASYEVQSMLIGLKYLPSHLPYLFKNHDLLFSAYHSNPDILVAPGMRAAIPLLSKHLNFDLHKIEHWMKYPHLDAEVIAVLKKQGLDVIHADEFITDAIRLKRRKVIAYLWEHQRHHFEAIHKILLRDSSDVELLRRGYQDSNVDAGHVIDGLLRAVTNPKPDAIKFLLSLITPTLARSYGDHGYVKTVIAELIARNAKPTKKTSFSEKWKRLQIHRLLKRKLRELEEN